LRIEELEPRIAPGVAVAYVDDDFNPSTPGWGVDHFALIQDGINAANTGGAVNVAAGVYSETVTLNKSATVTLSGAETVGSFLLSGGTISASSCSLTITGAYSEGGGLFVSSPTQGTFSVGGSFTLSGGTFSHSPAQARRPGTRI
jgi:hypothetical protein